MRRHVNERTFQPFDYTETPTAKAQIRHGIDSKQYPRHTWSSDGDGASDGGGGGGDGDDDTLCSGDDNDDGAGSVDISASKSSICAIL